MPLIQKLSKSLNLQAHIVASRQPEEEEEESKRKYLMEVAVDCEGLSFFLFGICCCFYCLLNMNDDL